MNAAISAKQTSMTKPAMISPTLAAGARLSFADMTFAASFTPAANTSDGAMPPPPAALAACRKPVNDRLAPRHRVLKQREEEAEKQDLIDDFCQPLAHIRSRGTRA